MPKNIFLSSNVIEQAENQTANITVPKNLPSYFRFAKFRIYTHF